MGISVNFDGVEATQGGGPLPEGEYLVVIDEAEQTTSQGGTPGVSTKLRVIRGEHEDRLLWDTIWITDKAMGVARWKLECAGLPIPQGQFNLEPRNLVGRKVKVVVKQEEYDGKVRARVKAWDSAGQNDGVADPMAGAAKPDEDIPF